LINTFGAVSAGIGVEVDALAVVGLVAAGFATLFAFGRGAAWARACADAPLASAATRMNATEIEHFIYFTAVGGV
jgi:hypothetical protein